MLSKLANILLPPYYYLCNSALRFAARRSWIFLAKVALFMGADIDASNPIKIVDRNWLLGTIPEGWRAIHYAAKKGNLAFVKFLVEKGAIICSEEDKTTHRGLEQKYPNSPICQASINGHAEVAEFLLEESDYKLEWINCNLDEIPAPIITLLLEKSKAKGIISSLLEMAIKHNKSVSFIQKLFDYGANIDASATDLLLLSRSRLPIDDKKGLMSLLMEKDAKIDLRNPDKNILRSCVLTQQTELVKLLLQRVLENPSQCLGIERINDEMATAAMYGSKETLSVFIKHPMDKYSTVAVVRHTISTTPNNKLPTELREIIAFYACEPVNLSDLLNRVIMKVEAEIEPNPDSLPFSSLRVSSVQVNLKLLRQHKAHIDGIELAAAQKVTEKNVTTTRLL